MARKTGDGPSPLLHLVLGEDSYLADEALEAILQKAIGSERADALTVLQGDEVRWERVINEARSGSLFATRRAVVVRRADLIRLPKEDDEDGSSSRRKKPPTDPVLEYLDEPNPDVTLVLLAAKPDRRRNPWKRISDRATLHPAEPKKGAALRAHVEAELRRRSLRLEPEAVKQLIDEVGQDLRRLMSEVDKLEAWKDDAKGPVTIDDVHAVLGRGLGRPLYLLADAASGRNVTGGVERLEELLEGGEEPLRILATLHRALRQVRAVAAMREARVPYEQMAQALRLPPNMQFKLQALLDDSRRWSEPDFRRALAALDRADRRMKLGADAATTLVAALAEACRGGEGAATSPRRGR